MQTAWLDTLRILAVFAVIVVHAASGTVVFSEIGSGDWWAGNVLDAFARWCVPAFVMISGALLLAPDKHEGALTFYAKRLSRVLIPLVFWSAFYLGGAGLEAALRGADLEAGDLLARLASGRPHYHLWYLFMVVPLYLVMPGLQRLTLMATRRSLVIVCALLFVAVGGYACVRYLYDIPAVPFVFWFVPYVPYLIAGHLLFTSKRHYKRSVAAAVVAVATVFTTFGCYGIAVRDDIYAGLYLYDYLSVTVIPMSLAVFVLVKDWTPSWIPLQASRPLATLTLGIYLIHPVFLGPITTLQASHLEMPALVSIPIASILSFGLSWGVAVTIQRIPVVRRII